MLDRLKRIARELQELIDELESDPTPPASPAVARRLAIAKTPVILTAHQQEIMDALEWRAYRTDALAAAVGCDRRRLFRPTSLAGLQNAGIVAWNPQAGFYRPGITPLPWATSGLAEAA